MQNKSVASVLILLFSTVAMAMEQIQQPFSESHHYNIYLQQGH